MATTSPPITRITRAHQKVRLYTDPDQVTEESSALVEADLYDENDVHIRSDSILSATYTLTDDSGSQIINERSKVPIQLTNPLKVVLLGDDLSLPIHAQPWRLLTIEVTYSSSLGINLPLKQQKRFRIKPLGAIPHQN